MLRWGVYTWKRPEQSTNGRTNKLLHSFSWSKSIFSQCLIEFTTVICDLVAITAWVNIKRVHEILSKHIRSYSLFMGVFLIFPMWIKIFCLFWKHQCWLHLIPLNKVEGYEIDCCSYVVYLGTISIITELEIFEFGWIIPLPSKFMVILVFYLALFILLLSQTK